MTKVAAASVVEVLYSFKYGGSERVGAVLAKQFLAGGTKAGAIGLYSGEGPVSRDLNSSGIPTVSLGPAVFRGRAVPLLFRRRLMEFSKVFPRPAIHVHHGLCLGLISPYLRLIRPSRVVYTEHATLELETHEAYRANVRRWVMQHADLVTVLHERMRDYFVNELALPGDKVVVVPNGVKVPMAEPKHVRSRSDKVRIIWVGRMHADKDLGTLIAAFNEVHAKARQPVSLLLVGDGPERERVSRDVRERGLEKDVEFLGFRDDVSQLMTDSDIFVLSSKTEGMPLVVLEAMAVGIPCVVTDVGGVGDCVDDVVGRIVPAMNPSRLACAVLELVESTSLREQLGARGFANVQRKFTLERTAGIYADLLGLQYRPSG